MKVLTIIFIAALLFSVAAEIQIAKVANTSGELTNIDWWPMFHYDLMHRGYSTSTGPTTNQTLWTFATGGAVETSPEVVDGRVYFGSDNGSIYALNASNGALIWNYSTGGPVQSSPAVVDGVVYIGGFHSHAVFALNAESGALLWNTPVDSVYPNEISSTALSNGIVYVTVLSATGGGGRLYALNATTGNFEWSYHPSAWLSSSPAVSDDNVYIRTSTGTVVSLNATSGEIIWLYYHRPDGSNSPSGTLTPIHSSLSIANGLVYVGTARETVQALDAHNGDFVWSGTVFGGVDQSCIAASDDMLYVATTWGGTSFPEDMRAGGISALNVATGSLVWNRTLGSVSYSSPAVVDGMVYVGSDPSFPPYDTIIGHEFYALDAVTGNVVWSYVTDGAIHSSPAIANGVVYVGSDDGKVYAFGGEQSASPEPPQQSESEPFPTTLAIASVIIVAVFSVVLLVYFKKRKH